jgi:transcriptional regulator with XRE-family HTH domain
MRSITAAQRQSRQQKGVRIAQTIEFAGLTQQELADALQERRGPASTRLTQGYLAQLISGQRNVADALLEQMAQITGVPLSYLAEGKGWEPPTPILSLLQTPAKTTLVPLDSATITQLRLYGVHAYRLSGAATKALAKAVATELAVKDRIDEKTKVMVIVLE